MIKVFKWIVGFTVWTLLYYMLNYFVFKNIFDSEIMNMNGVDKIILIFSMAISFLTSFDTKILRKSNILTHLSIPLILGSSKILEMFINMIIYIINKFSHIVSAPTLNSVDFTFKAIQNNNCLCGELHPLIAIYFTIIPIVIIFILINHYSDLNGSSWSDTDDLD
jgi:hypothetical protein